MDKNNPKGRVVGHVTPFLEFWDPCPSLEWVKPRASNLVHGLITESPSWWTKMTPIWALSGSRDSILKTRNSFPSLGCMKLWSRPQIWLRLNYGLRKHLADLSATAGLLVS